jgi:hypothetical protein
MEAMAGQLSPFGQPHLFAACRRKLGARAASNASTGRTLALCELCEQMPANVRVHHGRAASKDGRSRRGVTGASPHKPSALLPYDPSPMIPFEPRRMPLGCSRGALAHL